MELDETALAAPPAMGAHESAAPAVTNEYGPPDPGRDMS
jgi:hypothetical protein